MGKVKEYSNGEVTVVWDAEKCIHSANCVNGLPSVFKPDAKPWIVADGANSDALMKTIDRCPSGALSYYKTNEGDTSSASKGITVEVLENGPLLVQGTLKVKLKDGSEETKKRSTAFCRCGASQNKPYCDGAHSQQGFVG